MAMTSGLVSLLIFAGAGPAHALSLKERFDHLSANGNSNCSAKFLQSIRTMPPDVRLQGSCCGPMDFDQYAKQIGGLKKYAAITEIPTDPYDVEAGLAQRLLAADQTELTAPEQATFDSALELAEEGGPCCCKCWRWEVFGGLAKMLIRQRNFTGVQVAEVWDLSSGCGD